MSSDDFCNLIEKLYKVAEGNNGGIEEQECFIQRVVEIVGNFSASNIQNCTIIWNQQVNDTRPLPLLIYEENVLGSINRPYYFTDSIVQEQKPIGPLYGNNLNGEIPQYCTPNISAVHSFCIIPIENKINKSKAVIVFISMNKDIGFTKEQIYLLYRIINEIKTSKSDYLWDKEQLILNTLTQFTRENRTDWKLCDKYDIISEALETIKNHLKHFSIWKIDNIKNDNFTVIKERNQNFEGIPIENKYYKLDKDNSHKIIEYIGFLKRTGIEKDLDKKNVDIAKYIHADFFKEENFKNENSCFKKEYCNKVGIEVDKTVVLFFPIVPKSFIKGDRINILCLYINKIQKTLFRNKDWLVLLSNKIYESLTIHNQETANQTIHEILDSNKIQNQEEEFYKSMINVFISKADCENCFLYFKNERTNQFDIKYTQDSKFKEIGINEYKLPVPDKYIKDESFIKFIKGYTEESLLKKDGSAVVGNNIYYGDVFPANSAERVISALIVPIPNKEYVPKNGLYGFVLLLNKNKNNNKESVKYSPFFSIHNELIIESSIEYLFLYHEFKQSEDRKNRILKRIRHEIPHEVNLIQQNTQIVKKMIENLPIYFQTVDGNKQHYINVINQLALSNTRIELYASLATIMNLTSKDLEDRNKTESLDLNVYLGSMIDIYKKEGRSKGVNVEFTVPETHIVLTVSKLYKLAINNIVFNAIRYSRFGTCVKITVTPTSISIEDFGLPIKEEDDEKIYLEDYRGKEALKFTQDGMGYGLFFAKKVIEIHQNHKLTHESLADSPYNYYGMYALYKALNSTIWDDAQKMNIYNSQLFPEEKHSHQEFYRAVNELGKYVADSPGKYNQIDLDLTKQFVDMQFFKNKIMYDEFVRLFLNVETNKTTFTITF